MASIWFTHMLARLKGRESASTLKRLRGTRYLWGRLHGHWNAVRNGEERFAETKLESRAPPA